jgi:serine/threonine protein kinase
MSIDKRLELSDQWRAVIDCVDAFEDSGGVAVADLRSFIGRVDPSHRGAALNELVKVDLERGWKAGRPKSVGQYLREYPELGLASNPPADLIAFESELCRRHGGFPTEIQSDPSTKGAQRMPKAPSPSSADSVPNDQQVNTIPFDENYAPSAPKSFDRPTHIGRYRIVAELGAGTFGAVYRCFDEELKRDVAIKLPHSAQGAAPDMVEEFLHEARVAARLRHPGIVAILDANRTEDGRGYIVFEYIAGQTLQARILGADFDRTQAVRWIAEVADALHYAHKNSLVHRDIKPANILIDESGSAKLTDFGLAKMDDQFFMDDAGRVLGTVAYMNPEQASGQAHWASPQSDIYSLGVVLYELLCGKRPFTAGSSLDLIQQVEKRPPAPPRTVDDSIPSPLEDVCMKAMAKNPTERYNTAADMAAALRAAIAPPKGPNLFPRLAVAGIGVAALVVGIFYLAQSMKPTPPPAPLAPPFIELAIPVRRPSIHAEGEFAYLEDVSPLRIDDWVQVMCNFDREVYAYAIWYDSPTVPKLLWPPLDQLEKKDGEPEKQQRVMRLALPAGAKGSISSKWLQVTETSVPRFILVAASDKPLSRDELNAFIEQPYLVPPKVGPKGFVHDSQPVKQAVDTTRELASRGVAKNRGFEEASATVEGAKNALPENLLEACRQRFAAFELIGLSDARVVEADSPTK